MNVLDWFKANTRRQVKANVTVKPAKFYVGMLVKHDITKEVGLVTLISKRWVHVTWLAATEHENTHFSRGVLTPCSPGTRITIIQP